MHKGRPTFTRPRYYLYIEPLKGGLKCTEDATEGADTAGAGTTGGTKMTSYDLDRLIKKAKQRNDELYWNNYEWNKKHSEDPIWGGYFRAQMNRLEAEENQRYWDDFFRNTGISRDSVRYPIRAGLYSGVYNPNAGGFEASKAVMSLYRRW